MSSGPVLGSRSVIGPAYGARRPAEGRSAPPVTFQGVRRISRRAEAAVRLPLPRHPRRTDRRRRRCDGHDAAVGRSGARRFRGPRGLQRDPQRHASRTWCATSTAATSRRAPTPSRPTPSGPTCPTSPSTASRSGSASLPRRARSWRARSPTRCRRRTGRGSCSARSAPARSCRRWATSRSPASATPTPSAGAGSSRAAADAIVVETCQDLLQAKAAVLGVRQAMVAEGRPPADRRAGGRRDHRHDAARLGDRRRAHRPGGAGHRPHRAELLHRARRDERAPAHPVQARADPAVGDAQRGSARARPGRGGLPALARRAGRGAHRVREGLRRARSSAGAAAPPRRTSRPWSRRCATCSGPARHPRPEAGVSSLYAPVPFRQDTSVLMIGERTNANGSKKFRDAMLAEDWEACVGIAREQTREGAHLIDLCVDYVGRDGVADMAELAGRLATASTLPVMLDSTEPEVLRAGPGAPGRPLDHQLGELRRRRRARLALPAGDGAGGRARRGGRRAVHRRGGPGPHRGVEGPGGRPADPGPHHQPPAAGGRHRRRHADVPDHDRAGGGAPRRARDDRGDPRAQAPPPRRADHAGRLQRVVRAQPGRPAGAQLGVPARVRERGPGHRDRVRSQDPADGQDPGRAALGRPRPGLRPPPRGLRPAQPVHGALRGRLDVVGEGRARRGAGRAAAVRAAGAADRRRGADRAGGRPRRGAELPARPGDHQRHAAGGDEDRRRAVRLRARCSCRSCSPRPRS